MSTRLVALLRGVNVGRNKRISMSELGELLTALGYTDVRTLLQSGNVVFTCDYESVETADTKIEDAISRGLGVDCKVIVRTGTDLAAAIAADPFIDIATDPSRHLIGFLSAGPTRDGLLVVDGLDVAPDKILVIGRHIYLWCPEGILASPLNKLNLDRILGVAVTMRNWNTVTKLSALANG